MKYYKKIGSGENTRYFYTKEEYEGYLRKETDKKREAKKQDSKILEFGKPPEKAISATGKDISDYGKGKLLRIDPQSKHGNRGIVGKFKGFDKEGNVILETQKEGKGRYKAVPAKYLMPLAASYEEFSFDINTLIKSYVDETSYFNFKAELLKSYEKFLKAKSNLIKKTITVKPTKGKAYQKTVWVKPKTDDMKTTKNIADSLSSRKTDKKDLVPIRKQYINKEGNKKEAIVYVTKKEAKNKSAILEEKQINPSNILMERELKDINEMSIEDIKFIKNNKEAMGYFLTDNAGIFRHILNKAYIQSGMAEDAMQEVMLHIFDKISSLDGIVAKNESTEQQKELTEVNTLIQELLKKRKKEKSIDRQKEIDKKISGLKKERTQLINQIANQKVLTLSNKQPGKDFMNWVYTLSLNKMKDFKKREGKHEYYQVPLTNEATDKEGVDTELRDSLQDFRINIEEQGTANIVYNQVRDSLKPREKKIFDLKMQGLTNKEIANELKEYSGYKDISDERVRQILQKDIKPVFEKLFNKSVYIEYELFSLFKSAFELDFNEPLFKSVIEVEDWFITEMPFLEKGKWQYELFKAKDRTKLIKKTITNKAGKKQVVYVKPEEQEQTKQSKKQDEPKPKNDVEIKEEKKKRLKEVFKGFINAFTDIFTSKDAGIAQRGQDVEQISESQKQKIKTKKEQEKEKQKEQENKNE